MDKPALADALIFFRKTIYLSKILRAFKAVEKALLICAAVLTAGEALVIFRNIGKGK